MARNGAMVFKSADQSINQGAFLSFDSEAYDDGGWHDNSTNNTRFTVPVGVDRVRVGGEVGCASIDADTTAHAVIAKNGTIGWQFRASQSALHGPVNSQQPRVNINTGPVPCAQGDYFELWIQASGDSSFEVSANNTSFWIEAVS